MSEGIYLDHHATTPLDEGVLEKMLPYFTIEFGNASSIDHVHGNAAKQAVEDARSKIAHILGCRKTSEIIFTSGATESNNIALIGAFRKYKDRGNHIISTAIEHPSVLDTLEYLKQEGADVTLLPVNQYGQISLQRLEEEIKENTILISVMFANNEVGTIQPISEIGKIAKARKILFHCDAAQAASYESIKVDELGVDLLSLSSHKFYGPKGVGGVYIRSFSPMVRLTTVIHGGGHERGFRSGTLNVPGIVGMAEALVLAEQLKYTEKEKLRKLRDSIYIELKDAFPDIKLNGHPEKRLVHNLNIIIPGVEAKALMHKLKGKLSFSAGSACSTVKAKSSHVLQALGLDEEEIYQTIRIGFGRHNLLDTNISSTLITGIKEIKRK